MAEGGPVAFQGVLSHGCFSHHLCCHEAHRQMNALNWVPGSVRCFLSAQLATNFAEWEPM